MPFIFLCFQLVVQVLSEARLAPPQKIHVEGELLTWTPATQEKDVKYTVQSKGFDKEWKDLPACVSISFNSCNVKAENGCVNLRVRTERQGRISTPVEACSRRGDRCTPEVSLTVRPGSLTVNLSRNHSMALEHGGHAQHRVYYGKEGEPLEDYEYSDSSVSFSKLEQGQRYCVKVQYILHNKPIGLESCIQCEVIPEAEKKPKLMDGIVVVLVLTVLAALITGIAYILIFQRERIKRWLQPPCNIPDHFFLKLGPECRLHSFSSAESFDVPAVVEVSIQ